MMPSTELQQKVEEHFSKLSVLVQEFIGDGRGNGLVSKRWPLARAYFGLSSAGWWDSQVGVRLIREANREVTEFLMRHGVPASHQIDPKVAEFVWVDEFNLVA